jgi:hypothetical protein
VSIDDTQEFTLGAENIKFSVDHLTKPTSDPGVIPFRSHKSREIMSFKDFEERLKLMPMEDNIRQSIIKRVRVYPEASLDYVWKNLQGFINTAIKDLHPKAPKTELQPIPVVENTKPVEKTKVTPVVVRPSILEKLS